MIGKVQCLSESQQSKQEPSPLEVAAEVYRATREPFYVISPADIRHPCTLRGLEAAMGQAGNLQHGGPDQMVIAAGESGVKIVSPLLRRQGARWLSSRN